MDYPLDDFIEWFLDWAQPLLEKSNKINLSINLPEIPSKAPLAIGSPILENGSKLFANKRVQFEESVPKVLETSESCSETVDSSLTGSDSDFEDLSFSEREEVVEKLQDEHCSTFSGWSENHGTFRKVVSLENEKDTSISSKKRSIQEIGTPDRPTKRITLNDDHLSPLQSFQFRHSNIQLVRSQDSYPSTKSEATSKKGLSGAIWNFFELFGQS